MAIDSSIQDKITQYLSHAHRALTTGQLVMAHQDYIAAVNRAYYATFYAANALLATRGLERSKHSGVIAAFRQHFVKTGIVEVELSHFFGQVMDERHAGDYNLEPLDWSTASRHLEQCQLFITRVEQVLQQLGAKV